ncbi:MAG: glycosyltransferase, partial [bacterium]
MDDPPALSVVIASVNGYQYIAECLRSLERQRGRDRAEVLVVEASGNGAAERIAREYSWATVVPVAEPLPIPRLRSLGIRRSRGDIVVTTEDHCVFPDDWFDQILRAHQAHSAAAIGGAVENGSRERLVDWGAYICEYTGFMLPLAAGPSGQLPGPNVSYKRAALEAAAADLVAQGVWENVIHDRLRERGLQLWLEPSIVVYHVKRFGFWDFLTQRYYFGRSYAATRVKDAPAHVRAFFIVVSLLLPPLFLWRYVRSVVSRRRFFRELVKAFPLLLL